MRCIQPHLNTPVVSQRHGSPVIKYFSDWLVHEDLALAARKFQVIGIFFEVAGLIASLSLPVLVARRILVFVEILIEEVVLSFDCFLVNFFVKFKLDWHIDHVIETYGVAFVLDFLVDEGGAGDKYWSPLNEGHRLGGLICLDQRELLGLLR